jgi:glutathione S-transferase
MKLYGNPLSTCTRKVLTTLAETNTPFELVVVDLGKGEHKQTPHVERQPFGQIPTIDDEGFKLYESRAICRYINEKVGGSLIPKDLRARAVMEQWISIETSNFTPHAMKFIYEYVFKRPQGADVLDNAKKQLEIALDVMNARLAETPFLAGPQFSLADICFMPYVEYALGTPVKDTIVSRAQVAKWWKQVSERPTWRKVVGRG